MERVGILLIGVATLVYALSTAYVEINYMLIDKTDWEQTP
jgi:hypothetical protein